MLVPMLRARISILVASVWAVGSCAFGCAGQVSETDRQLQRLQDFHKRHAKEAPAMLQRLQQAVIGDENVFAVLMEAVRVCSLGQICNALFEVGGQYRRNM